jgi:hypothetical protein
MGDEPGRVDGVQMVCYRRYLAVRPGPGGGPFALLPCASSWSSRRAGSGFASGRWSALSPIGGPVEANPVLLFREGPPRIVADDRAPANNSGGVGRG